MKVAIITFHRAHNYGSILQAYALQQYIDTIPQCSCDIIDFSNTAQQDMYRVFRKKCTMHNLIRNLITLIGYNDISREYYEFEEFIEDKLKLTVERYYQENELDGLAELYDVFVAGSDQIWNLLCPDSDDAYFLSFVKNKKKIAYAPSFGANDINNVSGNKKNIYKQYLEEFDFLSIREKKGQLWLSSMVKKNIPLLIDPTLFYNKKSWEKIMSNQFVSQKYILYYAFHFSNEVNKKVKWISQQLRLPVIILNSRAWYFSGCRHLGFQLSEHSSPADFLRLVNDAELVLSNSFHGTVFSVIFEKKFWFLFGNVQNPNDDRALTLVQQLDIQDRVVKLDDIESKNLMEDIDYSNIRSKLATLRKEAFTYLERSLTNENDE